MRLESFADHDFLWASANCNNINSGQFYEAYDSLLKTKLI